METPFERASRIFRSKELIEAEGGCLLYPAKPDGYGYGQINVGGKVVKAHRVAWEIANGPIEGPGVYVDHRCHTPRCVNVKHLRLASPGQNLQNRAGATCRSSTGVRGVFMSRGKYVAVCQVGGVVHRRRGFDTVEDAAEYVSAKRRELMPFSEMDRRP